jgi:hypothetical protein
MYFNQKEGHVIIDAKTSKRCYCCEMCPLGRRSVCLFESMVDLVSKTSKLQRELCNTKNNNLRYTDLDPEQ